MVAAQILPFGGTFDCLILYPFFLIPWVETFGEEDLAELWNSC
jgi:hypothetical protein